MESWVTVTLAERRSHKMNGLAEPGFKSRIFITAYAYHATIKTCEKIDYLPWESTVKHLTPRPMLSQSTVSLFAMNYMIHYFHTVATRTTCYVWIIKYLFIWYNHTAIVKLTSNARLSLLYCTTPEKLLDTPDTNEAISLKPGEPPSGLHNL